MLFSKTIKLITVSVFLYTFQVGANIASVQNNDFSSGVSNSSPSDTHLSETFPSGYEFSLGIPLISKEEGSKAKTFTESLNVVIGKKNWNYQELYLNLDLKGGSDKNVILTAIPRIFYSFPIIGMKFYAGIGIGSGIQPHHIYSDEKDARKAFAIGGQVFTGLRAPNIHKNFGVFIDMNFTTMTFPFYSKTQYSVMESSYTYPDDPNPNSKDSSITTSPEDKQSPHPSYNNVSIRVGISYSF